LNGRKDIAAPPVAAEAAPQAVQKVVEDAQAVEVLKENGKVLFARRKVV